MSTPETKERSQDQTAVMELSRAIWSELNPPAEGTAEDKQAQKDAWNEAKGDMKTAVRKALRKMEKSGWTFVQKS